MKQQALLQSPLLALSMLGLFIFLGVFVLWVLRTYAKRAEAYAEVAALPLADDTGAARDRAENAGQNARSTEACHVQ